MNFIWAQTDAADSSSASGQAWPDWRPGLAGNRARSQSLSLLSGAQLSRRRIILCDEFYTVSVCDLWLDTVSDICDVSTQLVKLYVRGNRTSVGLFDVYIETC